MAKLITREDPNHLHAFVGLINLLHHIYRWYLFLKTGNAGFGLHMELDVISLSIMFLPFFTSFVFKHTPTMKRKNDPWTIWKEYRGHAVMFGCRSILLLGIHLYEQYFVPSGIRGFKYWRIAIVLSSFFVSKSITDMYPKQESTIRGMYKNSIAMTMAGLMQFLGNAGIMLGLFSPDDFLDVQWMAVFVIQMNAFNMTLRKKRISGPKFTQALYSLMLGTAFYMFVLRRWLAVPPDDFLDERLQFVYTAVLAYSCRRCGCDRFTSWITGLVVIGCIYGDPVFTGLLLSRRETSR